MKYIQPQGSPLTQLSLFACCHKTTRLKDREPFAFDSYEVAALLSEWKNSFPEIEVVLLSTCNRFECYLANESQKPLPTFKEVSQFLHHSKTLKQRHFGNTISFDDVLNVKTGLQAAERLFRVVSGIESLVLGDSQILGQVRTAYQTACDAKTAGTVLHSLFQSALRTGRRVVSETAMCEGQLSIPSVAIRHWKQQQNKSASKTRPNVLVIGSGEMAAKSLAYVSELRPGRTVLLGRNQKHVERLARKYSATAAQESALWGELTQADFVIAATSSKNPLITKTEYECKVAPRRAARPLAALDLSVPRNIEPSLSECHGVTLISVDDLKIACKQTLTDRDKATPAALQIVQEELTRWANMLSHRQAIPAILALQQKWNEAKNIELKLLFETCPVINDEEQQAITRSYERLMNKILHPAYDSLKNNVQETWAV